MYKSKLHSLTINQGGQFITLNKSHTAESKSRVGTVNLKVKKVEDSKRLQQRY